VDVFGQQVGCQNWRDRKGRDQRTREGIGIGPCHRTKYLTFDTLHGEERNEGCHRNRCRKQDGLVHLQRANHDEAKTVGPQITSPDSFLGRVCPPRFIGEVAQRGLPFLRSRLEIAEHVFDEDHRRIDDDAEVDGSDRQKVRVLSHQNENDDGEEQCERDITPTMIALRRSPRNIH